MIIDAHQHFWQLERGDYGWLTLETGVLYRDYMPDDLAPLLKRNGIDGTVLVQAAPTIAETHFMLEIAESTSEVLGVVGWIDFEAATAADDIASLAQHPKLVGLRPMIQGIADDTWMLRPDLAPAFEAIIAHDLTFDALVLPRHLPHLQTLLARYPNLRTVIDHGAKPDIAGDQFDIWAEQMSMLATTTQTFCKLSGLFTEAGPDWKIANVHRYAAHLISQFGTDRLVWGSDWPVLTLADSYDAWYNFAVQAVPEAHKREKIFGKNAFDLYRRLSVQSAR